VENHKEREIVDEKTRGEKMKQLKERE